MNIFKTLPALAGLLFLVSCGSQKPMVEDINVVPRHENGDFHVALSADLGLGNVMLPSASFPVTKDGEHIGNVSMNSLSGGNNLEIDINVSAAADIQTQSARLPNGSTLPLIGGNDVIVVPLGSRAELYIALSDGAAALGVSIPFRTLDSIGRKVGNTALFPVFSMNKVTGAAGLYFSRSSGQNGFGLFADISSVMDQTVFKGLGFRPDLQAQSALEYKSLRPSRYKKRRIDRELYYLNRRRARLRLH